MICAILTAYVTIPVFHANAPEQVRVNSFRVQENRGARNMKKISEYDKQCPSYYDGRSECKVFLTAITPTAVTITKVILF